MALFAEYPDGTTKEVAKVTVFVGGMPVGERDLRPTELPDHFGDEGGQLPTRVTRVCNENHSTVVTAIRKSLDIDDPMDTVVRFFANGHILEPNVVIKTPLPRYPRCDMCGHPDGTNDFAAPKQAAYDGKTYHGPWAYMCDECFAEHGVGLGLGRGQELRAEVAEPDPDPNFDTGPGERGTF